MYRLHTRSCFNIRFSPLFFQVLIISGGSYGDRLAKICSVMGLSHDIIRYKESEKVDLNTLRYSSSNNQTL